jgi:DNA-binding XRE family transcriptional regulator
MYIIHTGAHGTPLSVGQDYEWMHNIYVERTYSTMNWNQLMRTKYRNNVQLLRLKAGIAKQKTFAEKLGIKPQILCEIESNRRFLSSVYALRICEVLGCRMDELFEKTGRTIVGDPGNQS